MLLRNQGMTKTLFNMCAMTSRSAISARGWHALLLLATLVLACLWPARAQAQTGPDFLGTPTLVSGTNLQQGAVYRYTNVLPGIDALVTLAQFNNVTTLDQLDNPAPFPARFQPVIRCNANSNVTCWVRFNFQFVQSGNNTPAPLPRVVASAQDVDGGNGTGTQGTREFAEFVGATTVTVATPTFMALAPALAGGTRYIQSSSANAQGGIGTDNRYEIYANYPAGVSTFSIIGGNTIGGTACNPAAANDCNRLNSYTFTPSDANLASIIVRKTTVGGVGTFSFSGNNGYTAHTITTATAGTPAAALPQPLPPGATTITEAAPPAGYSLTGIACTGLGNPGGTATPTVNGTAGGSVALNAAAVTPGSNIVCTFTNTKLPILRLQKSLPSGRFVATDQFVLTIAGTGGPATVTTTGAGTTATGVATLNPGAVGAAYTFSETGAAGANLANYATTYSCTNALTGGQTPSGTATTFSVTAVAGDDLTCTLVNTRNALANLSLTKTNTPGVNGNVDQATDTVVSGATTTYTITVGNAGPDTVSNAVITDPTPTNLTCTTAACTATGGATCPVQTGAALVTALQGAGATVPTLPLGGAVTIALTCNVP
jgi:uncharacterized repeat protein (TIGR01451 family)